MYWELYQALFLLAGACTFAVFLRRESVIPLGFSGAALWAILALQARNITIYHQDGTSTIVGSEAWQFVALGLSLLLLGTVLLYWWGVFPPEDPAAEAPVIDDNTEVDNVQ
jgi:hypothetical protein